MSDTEKLDNEVRVIAEFGDVSDGTSYVEHGMAREIMRLRAENAALTAAVERVRAFHQPIAKDVPKCVICKNYDGRVDHPCPTLRALEGTP